jgi:cell division protein FtsQ
MSARPISVLSRVRMPALPSRRVLVRRLLLLAILAAALAAAYAFWFRDSSFVRVENVTVRGADNDAAAASALTSAAEGQSTLDFDVEALRAAVADDPNVASLTASTDFPHAVTVDVVAREPAGYIADGKGAVVAGDGTVLSTGNDRPDGIPEIDAEATSIGARAEGPALNVAKVLGAAPPQLLPQVESARADDDAGPVAVLTGGLELRFGDPSRAAQKWKAAAAVIASPDFEGAEYLDLSVPGRPVAG